MQIIGITGKSGSGKSTFASLLSQKLNCPHIDIDKIGHQALFQPDILDVLCDKFGKQILDNNGKLDRKKMGDIIFTNRQKMQDLSNLTWDYMKEQLDRILLQKHDMIILEWILLPHSRYWKQCNTKILVTANDEQRKSKVLERDNITEEYFAKRDSSSIDYTPFTFDFCFTNDYKQESMQNMLQVVQKEFMRGEER